MLRFNWKLFVCVVALACFVGCPQVSDRPATVEVTGTVTLDGATVAGATVAFSPKAVEGNAASGKTDDSGRFELGTFESGDGAVPGSYAVGVYKTEGPETAAAGATSDDDAYRAAEAAGQDVTGTGGAQAKEAPGPKDLLPVRYKSPGTSGLTAQVTESGSNEFNFALTTEEGAAAPEAPREAETSSDAPSE